MDNLESSRMFKPVNLGNTVHKPSNSYTVWPNNKFTIEKTSPFKTQVGGEHYKNSKIQPVHVWQDWGLEGCLAAAVKYIHRRGNKPENTKIQDLEKAIHYLQLEVEYLRLTE